MLFAFVKAEWNGTVSERLYLEARWGDFGYYDPRYSSSDEDYFWRDTTLLVLTGAHAESQTDRDRKQLTGATYFLDAKVGSHTFKIGGEVHNETQWSGRAQNVGGNVEHIYTNNVASQVNLRHSHRDLRVRPLRQRQRPAARGQQARSAGFVRQRHVVKGPRDRNVTPVGGTSSRTMTTRA